MKRSMIWEKTGTSNKSERREREDSRGDKCTRTKDNDTDL